MTSKEEKEGRKKRRKKGRDGGGKNDFEHRNIDGRWETNI